MTTTELKSKKDELENIINGKEVEFSKTKDFLENMIKDKLKDLLNPKNPIGVKLDLTSIMFFTCLGMNPEYKYAKNFGSDFTLYNQELVDFSEKREDNFSFIPEINYGSMSIRFDETGSAYQVTKMQMLSYISNEIDKYLNHSKKSEFVTLLIDTFRALKRMKNEIGVIGSECYQIKLQLDNIEKEEFHVKLKKGNIYIKHGETSFIYRVDKITKDFVHYAILDEMFCESAKNKVELEKSFNRFNGAVLQEN